MSITKVVKLCQDHVEKEKYADYLDMHILVQTRQLQKQ